MIQIDMEMPKNCLDCPACNEYLMCAIPANGRGWGENDVKDFSQSRPEWCPMKELVRCKGCKHWMPPSIGYKNADLGTCYGMGHGPQKSDWFCADGERK